MTRLRYLRVTVQLGDLEPVDVPLGRHPETHPIAGIGFALVERLVLLLIRKSGFSQRLRIFLKIF